jgi:hypothetical protein
MQFKHPEILYALLLLIIPIIIHLFQLQRFEKVPFTNVQFLKNVEQQTRKSSRLKKFLILLSRLLTFTCLIFAFAQPFLSNTKLEQQHNTTIYLDNSFSMQAKGENGELLKSSAQQIIDNIINQTNNITLITNNKSFKKSELKSLKNELISIDYTPSKLDLNAILLKINSLNDNTTGTLNKSIIISDFQDINLINKPDFTSMNGEVNLLKLSPKNNNNFFVDSIFISGNNSFETNLNVIVKSTLTSTKNLTLSLFSNSKLIGKTTARFDNSKISKISFSLPNTLNFNGKISLTDEALTFDNDFYFSISKPEKVDVLSIGETSEYLKRIYSENEFNFTTTPLLNLNYNQIKKQHLIVLNELEYIPNELGNEISEFVKNGGHIVIIPSPKTNINSYNTFLNSLLIGTIESKNEVEHQITTIRFDHPLIQDVFEKKVTNFQYPKTNLNYNTHFNNSSSIINFDSNEPFISSINKKSSTIYWFSSPLNKNFSNFTQSSLIVPIFYNFAKHSLKTSQLYYTVNLDKEIEIKTSLGKDQVLTISNESTEFIPLQTVSQNKATLKLNDNSLKSGFYNIKNGNETLQTIAFNYNRNESHLSYSDIEQLIKNNNNVSISSSIDNVFNKIYNQQKINWLFKWFLAFSILFLLIEMLLLKYFKI